MRVFQKSSKLDDVCYDIRGPVLKEAKRLEALGYRLLKLNIGNPGAFGFNAPDEIIHDMIINLQSAQGYCDSQGLFAARKAIMHDFQFKGVMDVKIDDIFIGNGVSELIVMAMQGLLNTGDEVLLPMPDYPLWTAAVTLAGGTAVHYRCDEGAAWQPDVEDIRAKLSARTKAIVVINPNNPTGAVYERQVLEDLARIAREQDLILYADEIYDRIVYDGVKAIPLSTVDPEVLTVTFNGLSKAYRSAGFRAGWMVLSGNKKSAADYLSGLELLSNMRICANVPGQLGIQTALGGYQSINDLILPGGRLKEQRDTAVTMLNAIPGMHVVAPRGALYCFPRVDTARFGIVDDERFVMDLLQKQRLLVVQGTGFNWPEPDHFRVVFLPDKETLQEAIGRIGVFLEHYRQE
ncbi:MAG: pyridoxal phosphate-dependent aminotransferase [Spirochaetaceae bacterium]|jgi:alanine-synthesizing transaminase|nr:pyridoxal phosphate-dependent aminotransferase [Spirochaetaceae bacterium]